MDIKNIAREKGMRFEDIANKLGITKGGLSKALNGNPTIGTLRRVAEALEVPVAELLRDEAGGNTAIHPEPHPLMQQTIEHGGKQLRITIDEIE
jgi:transcriptional regulator with XRE-family HTH domain